MKQIKKLLLIFVAVFCIIAPASIAYGASQTYTLTFDSNCNNDSSYTISITTKAVAQGDSYGILPAPTRKGYAFDGWYTAATGGTAVSATTTMGSNNTTVYAHWNAHKLTINYHNGGATGIKWDNGTTQNVEGEEVSVSQIEYYGQAFSNGQNGFYDVWRWIRTGYAVKNDYWTIGRYGTARLYDKKGFSSAQDCAEYMGVLSEFENEDVIVDLYPIWDVQNDAAASQKSVSTAVLAVIPESYFLIVPESVTMTGENGTGEKTSTIPVTIKGDIGLTQIITVTTTPPVMQRTGASDVTATVIAPKTQWDRTDALANDGNGTTSNYTVKATLTPGDWTGTAEFSCSIAAS